MRSKMMTIEDENIKEQLMQTNLQLLDRYTSRFLDAIFSAQTIAIMPVELKSACAQIKQLSEKYNFDPVPLIGSFVMLRYVIDSYLFVLLSIFWCWFRLFEQKELTHIGHVVCITS